MQTNNEQNPFYLKLETGTVHGGSRILAMTHLPRVFSLSQAMLLAAHLIKLAGGLDAFEETAREVGLIPDAPAPKDVPAIAEPNAAMRQAAGVQLGVIAKDGEAFTPAAIEPRPVPIAIQEPDPAPDASAESPAAQTSGSSPDAVTPAAS